MKTKLFFVSMLAIATWTSCSQNDALSSGEGTSQVSSVRITVSGGKGVSTRVGGTPQTGVGGENIIGAGWVVFAQDDTRNTAGNKLYRMYTATGTGTNGMLQSVTADNITVGSNIYVLANLNTNAVTQGNGTAITWTDFSARTDITEAEIVDLVNAQTKATINTFSTALQADPTNPDFTTHRMLMTGKAVAPSPVTGNTANLRIELQREYAKVNLVVENQLGTNFPTTPTTPAAPSVNSVDEAYVRRVVPKISPFLPVNVGVAGEQVRPDTWYSPVGAGFIKDESGNTDAPTTNATEFRYVYAVNDWNGAAGVSGTASFYVTPNYSRTKASSTAVIVKANVTADFDGDGTMDAAADRYYRAIIADAEYPYNGFDFMTDKNTIYNINATINSLGHPTEDDALHSDAVDLTVSITIQDWRLRDVITDFE